MPTQTKRSIAAVSSARMLAVPSLKPIRLRGVSWLRLVRRGAAEAELGPAHRHRAAADPGQVADRVEGDLGIVGAGLDADVAAAFERGQLVAGQRRDRLQRRRALRRQPEPAAFEQAGAEAEGDGQVGGQQADRLAGVVGRRQQHRR